MEKKLLKLAAILKTYFTISYVRYQVFNHTMSVVIEWECYNGEKFITDNTYDGLISKLISKGWIKESDIKLIKPTKK